ncbi:Aa_trans domain-containing protein [Fusarium acuminatum]|uniref:Aa_trans domain-containing protein n=1 Tax=Fusarium acuminatum TaxID=5515 RepID=A0ABZ2WME1_9HYPO
MPSVMSHMGIMLGVVLILWSGLTAAFGLYLQSRCARYLDRGTSSFFALSQITYPNAAVIFDAAIAIKCFGVGVSYMIIIGDLMPGVVLGFLSNANSAPYLVDRNFWITAFMLLIIPLSFLRRLDSLKYTSIVALVSIGYLIVLVIYHFASDKHADPGSIRVIQWGGAIETLSALPVVVFAYTCHQNTDPTGAASTIGKAAIVVLVTFSVPLQVHPCRASLDAVLKWRPNRGSSNNGRTAAPLLPTPPAGDHGSIAPISDLRFAVITTFILTFAYMTALSVTSLDRVLAFVGSTGSTSISFILPGLFYYKISNPDSIHHQRLAKEDDDIDEDSATSDVEDSAALAQSTASVRSGVSVASNASTRSNRNSWRWRRKWRWDLEHIEHHHLRRLALALAIYGSVVMTVCLVLNIFFAVTH